MVVKSQVPPGHAQKAQEKKKGKVKHAGKDWATLNTNDKFEIIGDFLKAEGFIDQ